MECYQSQWPAAFSQVPEDVLLLNVETTGLRASSSFVCMVSAGYRKENSIFCHTWLAGSRRDEKEMIEAVSGLASSFHRISTYGGNAFSFRFLKERWSIYSDSPLFDGIRLTDLQKEFRPLLQILPLTHLKKEDVEGFLGFNRRGVKAGKELIPVYQAWERDKSAGGSEIMLLHAQEDIRFLSEAFQLNSYLDLLQAKWNQVGLTKTSDGILFDIRLLSPVPKPVSWTTDYASFTIKDSTAQVLSVPFCGRLRYFLPGPCSDYYYLPAEDIAIHRSVAQFVDRRERVKASQETCYTNREGIFLPVPGSFPAPLFYASFRSLPAYTQFEKEKWQQDPSIAGKYLAAILQSSD